MKALIVFVLLWTPLCLFILYRLPDWFGDENRFSLGVIFWLVGFLVALYYLVARKWR
ncbi:MAG: hypothetical protein RIG61_12750 [Deltaproteobacteria bacterium]